MSQRSGILSARMWLLTLLEASDQVGIAPLSVERLHRLVYLANAMAPVYDLLTPDGYILKYKRGPFFPEVQWDIDRLSVQGLVRAANLARESDTLGWWFSADYSLTLNGRAAVDFAMGLEEVTRNSAFLREVVRAFAMMLRAESLDRSQADATLLEDVGYSRADEEGPVDFRNAQSNLTALAAVELGKRIADREQRSRRSDIHLYFRYLERKWHGQGMRAIA